MDEAVVEVLVVLVALGRVETVDVVELFELHVLRVDVDDGVELIVVLVDVDEEVVLIELCDDVVDVLVEEESMLLRVVLVDVLDCVRGTVLTVDVVETEDADVEVDVVELVLVFGLLTLVEVDVLDGCVDVDVDELVVSGLLEVALVDELVLVLLTVEFSANILASQARSSSSSSTVEFFVNIPASQARSSSAFSSLRSFSSTWVSLDWRNVPFCRATAFQARNGRELTACSATAD
mmetsp:Transcript_48388/g.115051  ORF Transcript_48388/g.115051 Transcript_48388/m.115051 type:complete len:236 (-) Transcript_48388:188-895(-)